MKSLHKAASDAFANKCLIANIDLHSNIDALEGLRGAQHLLYDLLDEPDTIGRAMLDVCSLYSKVYDEFYNYGMKAKLGTTSWLQLYSRDKYNPIQSDFICLLSPMMFRQFVLPSLEQEAAFLDHSCFHLDGQDALKHLDDILAIKAINTIQWVPGAGNKQQLEWPELLHKIQAAGKSIVLYVTPEQVRQVHGQYDPELLVYDVSVETEDQGHKLLEWLTKNT